MLHTRASNTRDKVRIKSTRAATEAMTVQMHPGCIGEALYRPCERPVFAHFRFRLLCLSSTQSHLLQLGTMAGAIPARLSQRPRGFLIHAHEHRKAVFARHKSLHHPLLPAASLSHLLPRARPSLTRRHKPRKVSMMSAETCGFSGEDVSAFAGEAEGHHRLHREGVRGSLRLLASRLLPANPDCLQ